MSAKRIFFFFAEADLKTMLRSVESAMDVQYLKRGTFPTADIRAITALSSNDNVGVSKWPSSVLGEHWLVGENGGAIRTRQLTARTGEPIFIVDPHVNNEAVVLSIGGEWNGEAILRSEAYIAHDHVISKQIFHLIARSAKSISRRVRGMYVGHEAHIRWQSGWRLTDDVRSPSGYDLHPEK